MRLVVISHTAHYYQQGQIVGWGPTVRELGALASLCTDLVHIAPLHDGPAPASSLPYSSPVVRLKAVPPAGGRSFIAKLGIVTQIPAYVRAMRQALAEADAVHVRCPANISLVALLYLALRRQPAKRWFKYAGNWQPQGAEPLSYRWQRWWLRRGWSGGVVTVNGRWPQQPTHVHTFHNPAFSRAEQAIAKQTVATKGLELPLNLLFVGALNQAKGVPQVLQVAASLQQQQIPFILHLLGDGPERPIFAAESERLGLATAVRFHGWLAKDGLAGYYAQAHFLLLPSRTEGWPKVLSEAMAYGVVPLGSQVSAIPQILAEIGCGQTFAANDATAFAQAICGYLQAPDQWQQESQAGSQAASQFTYEAYLQAVRKLLHI